MRNSQPRCSQDELYVQVLRWVGVLLIVALGAMLLASGFTMIVQASAAPWYANGAKLTGTTAALMALITLVFRLCQPRSLSARRARGPRVRRERR
jgi:hypothetical protein